jgi:hypothetical protein
MRSTAVEERDLVANRGPGLGHVSVGVVAVLLVFDRPPEPFHHEIGPPRTFAVHADLQTHIGRHLGELPAGELAALSSLKIYDLPKRVKASSIACSGWQKSEFDEKAYL